MAGSVGLHVAVEIFFFFLFRRERGPYLLLVYMARKNRPTREIVKNVKITETRKMSENTSFLAQHDSR